MKLLIVVAIFAFAAVQLSKSAPTPEEERKEVAATPVAAAEPPASPAAVAEVKSADPEPAPSAVVAATADEKKAS